MAMIVFVLELLTKILLVYPSSIHVVLRKRSEVASQRDSIFNHILQ
ncbi:hypothetical protein OROMI_028763 [Orobanche minor]